jgi:3-dehydroquinate synthase
MMKTMVRVSVKTRQRSYQALIENGLLERAGEHLTPLLGSRKRVFVVTVSPVRRRWGRQLLGSMTSAGFTATLVEMPDGESHKRLTTVEGLAEKLIRLGAERNAVIVALGGGVVGDVAGFLASVYMRGIDVVQIPTTVLAQVDASIGGKTGVNLQTGKNLIGTFHQPLQVLIDPAVLSTLPEREFHAGLYEALKCGVIGRPALFASLAKVRVKALRRDGDALEEVIAESVRLKAEVVSADEREGGLRRVLNLGHTIGHALEAETNYRQFLHGEAVAWGMIAAANISTAVKRLDQSTADEIRDAVFNLGPLPKVRVSSQKILRLLQTDKKTRNGVVHFVLPTQIGKVEIVNDVPAKVVTNAVEELRELSLVERALER